MSEFEERKEAINKFLPQYLESLGYSLTKNNPCPVCGQGENTPCMSYHSGYNKIHCFSCGTWGDALDVVGAVEGITGKWEQLERLESIFGGQSPKISPIKKKSPAPSINREDWERICTERLSVWCADRGADNYFYSRGLSDNTIKRYRLGFERQYNYAIIPYPNENYYFKRRIFKYNQYDKSKPTTAEAGEQPIFNVSALYTSDVCFVCEGAIDALSVIECGFNAVSLESAENTKKLLELLKAKPTTARLIIATDNDPTGNAVVSKLASVCDGRLVLPADIKDCNDFLIKNRKEFEKMLEAAINTPTQGQTPPTEVQQPVNSILQPIGAYRDAFLNELSTPKARVTSGYNNLDTMLCGGFENELYMLYASSGVGKSTLCLNIAENIVRYNENIHVIYYGLEMAAKEFYARGISRITYELDPQRAYSTGDILYYRKDTNGTFSRVHLKNYEGALFEYFNRYGKRLVIVEPAVLPTVEYICHTAMEYQQVNKCRVVVFVDYLQYISNSEAVAPDERSQLEYAVKQLKLLSHTMPVVCISSINRQSSTSGDVNLTSAKGSGLIEYTASMVWTLQTDHELTKAEKEQPPKYHGDYTKVMKLTAEKSRNGAIGEPVYFRFHTARNTFEETTLNLPIKTDYSNIKLKNK